MIPEESEEPLQRETDDNDSKRGKHTAMPASLTRRQRRGNDEVFIGADPRALLDTSNTSRSSDL